MLRKPALVAATNTERQAYKSIFDKFPVTYTLQTVLILFIIKL